MGRPAASRAVAAKPGESVRRGRAVPAARRSFVAVI
jgi:hypothetical protein